MEFLLWKECRAHTVAGKWRQWSLLGAGLYGGKKPCVRHMGQAGNVTEDRT